MTTALLGSDLASPLARAHDGVDEVLAAELTRCDSEQLLDAWRELERLRNRLTAVEHGFAAEAERRGLPAEHGAKNLPALIRGLLRVHPREAVARARAAAAAAPIVTLTGDVAPAPFAQVAAAQASGSISPRHAAVVVAAVESLPDALQAEHGAQLEAEFVGYAEQFDPHELGRIATRATTLLDQDGALADVAHRERHRDLTVSQRPDGSAVITGEATAELAERLLSVLDAMARPKPAADGVPDPRTAGQRRHDGLLDALEMLQRAETLPDVNGVSATVLLTMTAESWATGDGVATTGHGAVVPAREAIRIAGGDARVMTVIFDLAGGIVDWTDARRCFTECQRLVMTARDGGCTFPGCDAPPVWCQAHHLVDHADGGPTVVTNGGLVCGHHHRHAVAQGWRAELIDNCVAWIPPPWIDPTRKPRVNHLHRPD